MSTQDAHAQWNMLCFSDTEWFLNGSICWAVMWTVVVKFGFLSASHDILWGQAVGDPREGPRKKLLHHKFTDEHKDLTDRGQTDDSSVSC